jgi:hypothetical protein
MSGVSSAVLTIWTSKVMIALLEDDVIAFAGYLRNASLFVAQYCTAASVVPPMLTRVAIVFSLTSFLSTKNYSMKIDKFRQLNRV